MFEDQNPELIVRSIRLAGRLEVASQACGGAVKLSSEKVGMMRAALDPDAISQGGVLTRKEQYDLCVARDRLYQISTAVLQRAADLSG